MFQGVKQWATSSANIPNAIQAQLLFPIQRSDGRRPYYPSFFITWRGRRHEAEEPREQLSTNRRRRAIIVIKSPNILAIANYGANLWLQWSVEIPFLLGWELNGFR